MLSLISWKQCGYWKDGKTLYIRALRATQNNCLAFNNLGLILFSEGDIQGAIRHYDQAINICDDVLIYNNRGRAYMELGRYQRALEDFNRATDLQPDYADTYSNRGMAYAKLGMYQNAIADLNEAIRLSPFYADYYARRAMVYLTQKNNQQGCADAQAACALGSCFILNEAQKRKDCVR
jgi:tetratricopeptide (TPR) repeat protein